jgi:hypothetical protein
VARRPPVADPAADLDRTSEERVKSDDFDGKHDVMVPTVDSYALFQPLPDARLLHYPNSGRGAPFQCAKKFVRQGLQFLNERQRD